MQKMEIREKRQAMRTEVKETVRRRGERDKRGHSGKPGKRDSGVERREKRQARE